MIVNLLDHIKHPIEGIAYLTYLSLFLRWKYPITWNRFLQNLMNKSTDNTN